MVHWSWILLLLPLLYLAVRQKNAGPKLVRVQANDLGATKAECSEYGTLRTIQSRAASLVTAIRHRDAYEVLYRSPRHACRATAPTIKPGLIEHRRLMGKAAIPVKSEEPSPSYFRSRYVAQGTVRLTIKVTPYQGGATVQRKATLFKTSRRQGAPCRQRLRDIPLKPVRTEGHVEDDKLFAAMQLELAQWDANGRPVAWSNEATPKQLPPPPPERSQAPAAAVIPAPKREKPPREYRGFVLTMGFKDRTIADRENTNALATPTTKTFKDYCITLRGADGEDTDVWGRGLHTVAGQIGLKLGEEVVIVQDKTEKVVIPAKGEHPESTHYRKHFRIERIIDGKSQ